MGGPQTFLHGPQLLLGLLDIRQQLRLLLRKAVQPLLHEGCTTQRPHAGRDLRGQHQRFGLRAGNGIAGMGCHRQPEAAVSRTAQTQQRRLIAQPDLIVHVPIGGVGIGRTGVGHRPPGQVAVINQPRLPVQGQPHFLVDQGLAELVQHLHDLLGFGQGQLSQGPAHAAVIGPAVLAPGFGHLVILIKRMGRATNVLQVLNTPQRGDQVLDDFGLRWMHNRLLVQRHRTQRLDQAQTVAKLAPDDQHRMHGERLALIFAHDDHSFEGHHEHSRRDSLVKVRFLRPF